MVEKLRVGSLVLIHQNERRTGDRVERTPTPGNPLGERGFAGSQVSVEADQVTAFEHLTQPDPDAARLLRAVAEELEA